MPDQTTAKRFRELLTRLFDDDISDSGIRELTALVKSHQEFSDELRAQLLMDSHLAQYENKSHQAERFNLAVAAALDAEEDSDAFVEKVVQQRDREDSKLASPTMPWIFAIASVAACIALVVHGLLPEKEDTTSDGVGIIMSLIGDLKFDGEPRVEGNALDTGIVEIDGYATLEFDKGARLSIAGPAKLELINSQRVVCHFGKIRANVPSLAKGFTVVTSKSEIVDIGTEFAMEVQPNGQTEVHVFEGEVEAYDSYRNPDSLKRLTAGRAVKISNANPWETISIESNRFEDLTNINQMALDEDAQKMKKWRAVNSRAKTDSRLIAYYDFVPEPGNERTLVNRAPTGTIHDGVIIGARWIEAPWPGKNALLFKRGIDRVRLNLTGKYQDITLAAWVRIDGLDLPHNPLFMTEDYDPGEIHWQVRSNGSLTTGLHYNKAGEININQYDFMDHARLGRWFHLVTVIDQSNQKVSHYLDGELLGEKPVKGKGQQWVFGNAAIGHWDHPLKKHLRKRRLNGAIAELMIFKTAIEPDEIRELSLN